MDIRLSLEKDKNKDLKRIVDKSNSIYENMPKSLGIRPYKKDYYMLFLYAMIAYMAELMPENNQKIDKIVDILKSEVEYSKKSKNEKYVFERIFSFAKAAKDDALCLLWQDGLSLLEKEEGLESLEELIDGLEKIS